MSIERFAGPHTPRILQPPEIGLLLIRINQLSQGEKTLVEELLTAVADVCPSWRIPEMRLDQLVDALRSRFVAIVGNPLLHKSGIDPTSVELELESQLMHMGIVFNDRAETRDQDDHRALLEQALGSIVGREYKYLVTERGRPRRGPERSGMMYDPHASYVLEYLVRRRPTGNEGLDAVCARMTELLENPELWRDVGGRNHMQEQLAEVIRAYNAHHLGASWHAHSPTPSGDDDAAAM